MANKKATTEYIQKLIESMRGYAEEIKLEVPYRLRNTSAFWKRYSLSFFRYQKHIKDESVDLSLRIQMQDAMSYLGSCIDEYNLLYMIECKKNATPFTPEELVAFKRYHKVFDHYSWWLENEQRMAEKEAGRSYYVEPFAR